MENLHTEGTCGSETSCSHTFPSWRFVFNRIPHGRERSVCCIWITCHWSAVGLAYLVHEALVDANQAYLSRELSDSWRGYITLITLYTLLNSIDVVLDGDPSRAQSLSRANMTVSCFSAWRSYWHTVHSTTCLLLRESVCKPDHVHVNIQYACFYIAPVTRALELVIG